MAQIYRFDLSFVRECSAECANGVTFDLRLAGQSPRPWSPALGHRLKGHAIGAVQRGDLRLRAQIGRAKGIVCASEVTFGAAGELDGSSHCASEVTLHSEEWERPRLRQRGDLRGLMDALD